MKRSARLSLLVLACLSAAGVARAQPWSHRFAGPREAARLADTSATVRREAARALGRWGEPRRAVAVLSAALPGEREATVRREILLALARRGNPTAVPAVADALASSGSLDRVSAAEALGAFQTPQATRALVAALEEEDVRAAAQRALVRIGPPSVPPLVRALRTPSLRLTVLRTLGMLRDPRAAAPVAALVAEEHEDERVAALRALGSIGDERASPTVAAALLDPSDAVALAALVALGSVGTVTDAAALTPHLDEGPEEHRRAALRSLFRLDRPRAIRRMEAAVSRGEPILSPIAVELALGATDPALVPLLFGLIREGTRAEEAASALAELDGGAGIRILTTVAQEAGPHAEWVARALAIGVRRHHDDIGATLRRRAWEALRGAAPGRDARRRMLLRALARDPWVAPWLIEALGSPSVSRRAAAAQGLEMLGDAAHGEAVVAALLEESDPDVVRRLADAAVRLGARAPAAALQSRLADEDTAPELMALAGSSLPGATARRRRQIGALLRAGLRSDKPRVRAGAARALALAADRRAARPLAFALDDPATEVRHAAARALAVLASPEVAPLVEARLRIELDPLVATALRDAASAGRRRPADPQGVVGDRVLRVRIVAAGEEGRQGVPVDAVLPDARWLRTRTLPSGELMLADLPAGVVDVRVRIGD